MWRRHRHGRRSLFVKLVLVAIVAGVLVNVVAVQGVRHLFVTSSGGWRELVVRHGARYVDSLIRELGSPPSEERVRALSDELDADIRVIDIREGAGRRMWESRPGLPSQDEVVRAIRGTMPGMGWGQVSGRSFVRRAHGGYMYVFFWAKRHGWDIPWRPVAVLVLLLSGILGGAWLALRQMLQPLKELENGVERIAEGDFAHRVEVCRHDELGTLADSFNRMADRIGGMLRSREQLLLDVSHELRSPLTRLRLGLELVPEQGAREGLAEDVREMERMVEEILETQRLDAPGGGLRKEALDLATLVREESARYRDRKPGVTVTAPSQLAFHGDETRLRSVLRNLVENALKYSGDAARPVEVTLAEDGAAATLTVRDHGPGIPADERENVFKPFYRVDKSRTKQTGGFGLGLSLVRKVVEAHGGTIRIDGEDGARVTVRLPAVPRG